MSPLLQFADVVKRFGSGTTEVRALSDINLTIERGEFVAIMGPSGCGKSTLLHLAAGLDDPTAGRVAVDGCDLATLNAHGRAVLRRETVGVIFQRLNLIPTLSALENTMLPLELRGLASRDARERARHALERVGIAQQLDRYPDDFSGGQQQRIAVARALAADQPLILADEPTGSLDTANGDAVIELLVSLVEYDGRTVVLVTHEPRFSALANRVVFLRDGRVVSETESAPELVP